MVLIHHNSADFESIRIAHRNIAGTLSKAWAARADSMRVSRLTTLPLKRRPQRRIPPLPQNLLNPPPHRLIAAIQPQAPPTHPAPISRRPAPASPAKTPPLHPAAALPLQAATPSGPAREHCPPRPPVVKETPPPTAILLKPVPPARRFPPSTPGTSPQIRAIHRCQPQQSGEALRHHLFIRIADQRLKSKQQHSRILPGLGDSPNRARARGRLPIRQQRHAFRQCIGMRHPRQPLRAQPSQRRRGVHPGTEARLHLHMSDPCQINRSRGMIHRSQRLRDHGQRLASRIALPRILHPFRKSIRQRLSQRHGFQATHRIRGRRRHMIALMKEKRRKIPLQIEVFRRIPDSFDRSQGLFCGGSFRHPTIMAVKSVTYNENSETAARKLQLAHTSST